MNYKSVYTKIINNAKSENRIRLPKSNSNWKYYELHHILPKSLFPNWTKRKSNLILLTAREHFFCHQLLDKIYPNEKMFLALWRLANDGQNKYCIKGSREYEKLKLRFSEFSSKLHSGNKYCKGIKWSEEVCKKRGNSLKGKNKGKTTYNNGKIAICILGEPPEGFVKGIIPSNRPSRKGKPHWSKYKGITEEYRKKLSEAHKGYKKSDQERLNHSEGMKGMNTWTKGRHWYTNGSESAQLESCPKGWWEGRGNFSENHKKNLSEKAKINRHKRFWTHDILCIETNEIFTNHQQLLERFPKGVKKPKYVCQGKMDSYLGLHFKYVETK